MGNSFTSSITAQHGWFCTGKARSLSCTVCQRWSQWLHGLQCGCAMDVFCVFVQGPYACKNINYLLQHYILNVWWICQLSILLWKAKFTNYGLQCKGNYYLTSSFGQLWQLPGNSFICEHLWRPLETSGE